MRANQNLYNLQHRLQVICYLKGCFGLALDLFHSNSISDFNQGQSSCEIDIKDTL